MLKVGCHLFMFSFLFREGHIHTDAEREQAQSLRQNDTSILASARQKIQAYLEPIRTCTIELFVKIVDGLTVFSKMFQIHLWKTHKMNYLAKLNCGISYRSCPQDIFLDGLLNEKIYFFENFCQGQ